MMRSRSVQRQESSFNLFHPADSKPQYLSRFFFILLLLLICWGSRAQVDLVATPPSNEEEPAVSLTFTASFFPEPSITIPPEPPLAPCPTNPDQLGFGTTADFLDYFRDVIASSHPNATTTNSSNSTTSTNDTISTANILPSYKTVVFSMCPNTVYQTLNLTNFTLEQQQQQQQESMNTDGTETMGTMPLDEGENSTTSLHPLVYFHLVITCNNNDVPCQWQSDGGSSHFVWDDTTTNENAAWFKIASTTFQNIEFTQANQDASIQLKLLAMAPSLSSLLSFDENNNDSDSTSFAMTHDDPFAVVAFENCIWQQNEGATNIIEMQFVGGSSSKQQELNGGDDTMGATITTATMTDAEPIIDVADRQTQAPRNNINSEGPAVLAARQEQGDTPDDSTLVVDQPEEPPLVIDGVDPQLQQEEPFLVIDGPSPVDPQVVQQQEPEEPLLIVDGPSFVGGDEFTFFQDENDLNEKFQTDLNDELEEFLLKTATKVQFQNCIWRENTVISSLIVARSQSLDDSMNDDDNVTAASFALPFLSSVAFEQCKFEANDVGNNLIDLSNNTTTISLFSSASTTILIPHFQDVSYQHNQVGGPSLVQISFLTGGSGNNYSDAILPALDQEQQGQQDFDLSASIQRWTMEISEQNNICVENNTQMGMDEDNKCEGTLTLLSLGENETDCSSLNTTAAKNDTNCASVCIPHKNCSSTTFSRTAITNFTGLDCVYNWTQLVTKVENLGNSIADGNDDGKIQLCPHTVLDMNDPDSDGEPLRFREWDAHIFCGGNSDNCTITGGSTQVMVQDGVSRVIFEGVTFRDSSQASIVIRIDPSEPAHIEFNDCEWIQHRGGTSVVLIDSVDNGAGSTNRQRRRKLQDENTVLLISPAPDDPVEANVYFRGVSFVENSVTGHMVSNLGGVALEIRNCLFYNNRVRGLGSLKANSALVATLSGSLVLDSIRMDENVVTKGLVFVGRSQNTDNQQQLQFGNICITGEDDSSNETSTNETTTTSNDDGVCDGIFYQGNPSAASCETASFGNLIVDNSPASPECQDRCEAFPACGAFLQSCYSAYWELDLAIRLSDETEFIICPASTLDVDDTIASDSHPSMLWIDRDVTLQCGEEGNRQDSCVIAGGQHHVTISTTSSQPLMIEFKGITFANASDISVQIIAEGPLAADDAMTSTEMETSSISFSDCEWKGNDGSTAILIKDSESLMGNETISFKSDSIVAPMVNVSNSSFVSNSLSSSIITNGGAYLHVRNVDISENDVEESAIEALGGSTQLSNVEFRGNIVRRGLVYVRNGAEFGFTPTMSNSGGSFDGLCGLNNTAIDVDCPGILFDNNNSSDCLESLEGCAQETGCQSLTQCEAKPQDCYDDYPSLFQDLFLSSGNQDFVVCPSTTFRLGENDPPLVISSDNIKISCGDSRLRSGSCRIEGGAVQVSINATNVLVSGMTFSGSTAIGIGAFGDETAKATFHACEFIGHTGGTVIAVYNTEGVEESIPSIGRRNLQIVDLPEKPQNPSMLIEIDSCLFENNYVEAAPLGNIGGTVNIFNSEFRNNTGMGAGAILSIFDANLTATQSCFIQNKGNFSGAILLQEGAQIKEQSNNFGLENIVLDGECTDILVDEPLACIGFNGTACAVTAIDTPPAPFEEEPPFSPAPTQIPASEPTRPPPTTAAPTAPEPCLDQWPDVFTSVAEAIEGESIVICGGTEFDLSSADNIDFIPLTMSTSNVTIRCASKRLDACVWSGGAEQLAITGSVTSVLIKGITFIKASGISVNATLVPPFSVEFSDCDWKNNTGNVTIEVVNKNALPEPVTDDLLEGTGGLRRLQAAEETSDFICDRCLFSSNTVNEEVISAVGTQLTLRSSEFRNNDAEESLVLAQSSSVSISDSCFTDSTIPTDGSLVRALDSNVESENSFLDSGGGQAGCTGFFDADGNCTQLGSSDSCVAASQRCHADRDSLVEALSRNQGSVTTLTICENSIFDFEGEEPIEISTSNTRIQCGFPSSRRNNCFMTGGGIQFLVTGSPQGLSINGLTFSGASIVSIHAAGDRSARMEIIDCFFFGTEGEAPVLVYNGQLPNSFSGRRRLAITDYEAPSERSMVVDIKFSEFRNNDVSLAPIACLGGSIIVESCQFESNTGLSGGIAVWFEGSMELSRSCFRQNVGSSAGAVFFNGDTTSEEDNWSDDSTVDGNNACTDLFLATGCAIDGQACDGTCVAFSSETCAADFAPTISPTIAPSVPAEPTAAPETCFREWEDLRTAITDTNVTGSGVESVFVICTNATMEVTGLEPIDVNATDLTEISIECETRRDLSCTINGGSSHFRMLGEHTIISFRDIVFANSTDVSFIGQARNSLAHFERCHWTDCQGEAAVLVYSGDSLESNSTNIEELSVEMETNSSMLVTLDRCDFVGNRVSHSLVANIGGNLVIRDNVFLDNELLSAAAVFVSSFATATIVDSCFLQTESSLPGTIFIGNASRLEDNSINNFGSMNNVTVGNCTDLFLLGDGEDCSTDECTGTCVPFDAIECQVLEFDLPGILLPSSNDTDREPTQDALSLELRRVNLFSSLFFVRNIFIPLFILAAGVATYFYFKKQYEGGDKAAGESERILAVPAHMDDGDEEFGDEIPETSEADRGEEPKQPSKKKSFFAFGGGKDKNKNKEDDKKAAPAPNDEASAAMHSASFRSTEYESGYGSEGYGDEDENNIGEDDDDDKVELT